MSTRVPILSPRARRGRNLPFAAVLLVAVATALGTAYTISTLRGAADASRRAQSLLANLDATVQEQTALEFQAIAGGGLGAAEGRDLLAARDRAGTILEALAVDERSSFGLPGIRAALESYLGALDEELGALGSGDIALATAIDAASVDPARDTFERVLRATEARLADAAVDSGLAADVGTLSALLSAAILVSLFFRRWDRTRRRNAFLHGQQLGLRQSEARFRGLVQHSSDLITVVERGGTIAYVSASASRLLDRSAESLAGTSLAELIHPHDGGQLEALLAAPSNEVAGRTIEWQLRTGDGDRMRESWRRFESVASPVNPLDARSAIILNSRDVTQRRVLEESLRHQATHDNLTGLVNRAVLIEATQRAIAHTRRTRKRVALLFLDLDDFKAVNDTFGHATGDIALAEVAARIRRAVRSDGVVARFGGDEFAVLLEEIETEEQAQAVADRVVSAVGGPLLIEGHEHRIAASVGIALSPAKLVGASVLIAAADRAMYAAKAGADGRPVVVAAEEPGVSAA